MGGNTSKTRRLTVENNDPTGVITLSDDVVDRIRGVSQTVGQPAPGSSQNTPSPYETTVLPVYLHEPSVTSVQIRQANVAELQKNDDYWENRLKALKENHKKINTVMEAEYRKALEELKSGKQNQLLEEIPCLESKKAVINCYRCNPNEPMQCAKIVQAFQECVDHKRLCLLEGRTSSKG